MYRHASSSAGARAPWRPLAALLVLLALAAPSVHAMVADMDVAALTRDARWVLEGRVLEAYSDWDPSRSRIYTYVTIRIDAQHKGRFPLGEIRLRVLGGEVGGISMTVPEGPSFRQDQDLVLFLGPNPQTWFPVVGLSQGLFAVTGEPGSEVARNSRGLTFRRTALLEQVRQAVAEEVR